MTHPITTGIHHLGLTVPDIEQARAFFIDALGFQFVAEKPDYPAIFVSDGTVLLTLWQAKVESPAAFDRRANLGLHHFALRLSDDRDLMEVYEMLARRSDVEIEFAPEALGEGPTRHLMCTILGGIRMELIAPQVKQKRS